MVLTNYRKFIVERYLEMGDTITIEEYCKNICRKFVKVQDFKVWLRLYDFQPLKIQLEKELELSKKETQSVELELRKIRQELEITQFVITDRNSKLTNCTIELSKLKIQNKKQKIEFEKENLKLKAELEHARFKIIQVQSELDDSLEDLNSSKKIFQDPKSCAKTFVDNKTEQLLIENTIEEFKNYFKLSSYKSVFLELGIQIKVSDEGSVRLNKLMKNFSYKTAYEAIRFFKQNKINPISIEQKPVVKEKVSFMAFSIDPSHNSIGFVNPKEIEQRTKLNEREF